MILFIAKYVCFCLFLSLRHHAALLALIIYCLALKLVISSYLYSIAVEVILSDIFPIYLQLSGFLLINPTIFLHCCLIARDICFCVKVFHCSFGKMFPQSSSMLLFYICPLLLIKTTILLLSVVHVANASPVTDSIFPTFIYLSSSFIGFALIFSII